MEQIEIEKIDRHDRTLCVSYPLEDALLAASVRTYGIRTPLILLDSRPHTIVTGFKRLEAAIESRYSTIPCVIVRVEKKEALLTAINDNLKRPMNLVERALSLEKMCALGFSQDEVFEMMRLLGFEPHDKVLSTLRALARTPSFVWDFVVAHALNLTTTDLLLGFDSATVKSLVEHLSGMTATTSHIREILQLLALARLKDRAFALDELDCAKNPDELRLLLKRRTHPVFSGLEERMRNLKAQAALPQHVRLRVDPFFERESIGVEITARNEHDVDEALNKLNHLLQDGFFRNVFELTKGSSGN